MRSIVQVLTASPDDLLTSVERMKADLGITVDTYDDQIENLIEEAASAVQAFLGRRLPLEKVEETIRPDGVWECASALLLDRQPVTEIISVTVDDTALTSTEWEVQEKAGAVYRLDSNGAARQWEWCKKVVITYWGGYVLPDDTDRTLEPAIENACAALARSLWYGRKRDPSVKAVEVPDLIKTDYWVGAIGQNASLPQDVERMLAPFKRRRI